MKKSTLENGQTISISEESYRALQNCVSAETIIPESIAEFEGSCNLRNSENKNQYMYYLNANECLHITFNSVCWKDTPTVKMVKANEINDIKVGDLVRFTGDNSFNNYTARTGYPNLKLMLVTKVQAGCVHVQYWRKNKCESNIIRFDCGDKWEVSNPI